MLEYTTAALDKIVQDFKRVIFGTNVATRLIYISYLLYALAVSAGILWINVSLLSITALYLAFFVVSQCKREKIPRGCRELVRRYSAWVTLAVKFLALVSTVYGIYVATSHVSVVTVSLAAFSVMGFAIQIVLEIIRYIIVDRVELLKTGFQKDMEPITKPVRAIGNVIKRAKGEDEVEAPELDEKKLGKLERAVLERRQRKAAAKAEAKAARLAKKQAARSEEPLMK